MNKKTTRGRHGEVFLLPIPESEMPKGTYKKVKNQMIGHSETGNHHVLKSEQEFETLEKDGDLFIRLFGEATMQHQKQIERHHDMVFLPGTYKRYKMFEFNPILDEVTETWD